MTKQPWNDFQLPRLCTHKLAERGKEVLERIARAGVTVPVDNRVARAVRAMDVLNERIRAGQDVSPSEVEYQQTLVEAHRLLFEALVIVFARWERRAGPNTVTKEHLAALLNGGDLPNPDFDHSRNLQFEAYVGATLALSGLSVRYAEPDFAFSFYDGELGVAAKRLTSRKPTKLFDRFREASKQLVDSGRRGYVAVNLDNWIEEPLHSEDPEEVGKQFETELREAYRALAKASSREAIRGAMIYANWNKWDFSGKRSRFALRSAEQTLALTDEENDEQQALEFFESEKARLRNSFHEISLLLAPTP